jgi:hypothetical protein
MQPVPSSPISSPPSSSEWTVAYLPALVGRCDAALRQVASLESRSPSSSSLPSLAWATRALWVLDRPARAARMLEVSLRLGGKTSAELGTLARPMEGPGYAYMRLALAQNSTEVSEVRCDLAVLALRRSEILRARRHIRDALQASPKHLESQRWDRLLTQHTESVTRWRHREAPVSSVAACMLLDLWPDASNGFLSPCRFRRIRRDSTC